MQTPQFTPWLFLAAAWLHRLLPNRAPVGDLLETQPGSAVPVGGGTTLGSTLGPPTPSAPLPGAAPQPQAEGAGLAVPSPASRGTALRRGGSGMSDDLVFPRCWLLALRTNLRSGSRLMMLPRISGKGGGVVSSGGPGDRDPQRQPPLVSLRLSASATALSLVAWKQKSAGETSASFPQLSAGT